MVVQVYIVAHVPPGVYERTPNINFFNTPKDGVGEQIGWFKFNINIFCIVYMLGIYPYSKC